MHSYKNYQHHLYKTTKFFPNKSAKCNLNYLLLSFLVIRYVKLCYNMKIKYILRNILFVFCYYLLLIFFKISTD